jgi:hypothetical protein
MNLIGDVCFAAARAAADEFVLRHDLCDNFPDIFLPLKVRQSIYYSPMRLTRRLPLLVESQKISVSGYYNPTFPRRIG